MIRINLASTAKAVDKTLKKEMDALLADTATAQNAALRKAQTLTAGTRGFLPKLGYSKDVLKRRVRVGKERIFIGKSIRGRDLSVHLWFGANEIPAEHFKGNVKGIRVGAKDISTARDGFIPRSFVIALRKRPPVGKKLYLQRYASGRGKYRRILTDISKEMEAARDYAEQVYGREVVKEYEKALEKRQKTAAKRRAKARAR